MTPGPQNTTVASLPSRWERWWRREEWGGVRRSEGSGEKERKMRGQGREKWVSGGWRGGKAKYVRRIWGAWAWTPPPSPIPSDQSVRSRDHQRCCIPEEDLQGGRWYGERGLLGFRHLIWWDKRRRRRKEVRRKEEGEEGRWKKGNPKEMMTKMRRTEVLINKTNAKRRAQPRLCIWRKEGEGRRERDAVIRKDADSIISGAEKAAPGRCEGRDCRVHWIDS